MPSLRVQGMTFGVGGDWTGSREDRAPLPGIDWRDMGAGSEEERAPTMLGPGSVSRE